MAGCCVWPAPRLALAPRIFNFSLLAEFLVRSPEAERRGLAAAALAAAATTEAARREAEERRLAKKEQLLEPPTIPLPPAPSEEKKLPQGETFDIPEASLPWHLPPNIGPHELIWLLRHLPELRDVPSRLRIPLVRQLLPYGILTAGRVTATLISTYQNPNVWLGVDGASLGARAGMPQALIGKTQGGWTAGLRLPFDSLSVPSEPGVTNPEMYSVSKAYSTYVHFSAQGFWNSTVTVDVNLIDLSAGAGAARVSAQSGVYMQFKPGPVAVASAILVGLGVLAVTPWPDEPALPAILEGVRRILGGVVPLPVR